MLTVIYWMEHRAPNEGAGESNQGAKRGLQPYKKNNYELTSAPQSCVSSCICSRGWPNWPSMGGEALGLAKIYAPVQGNARAWKQEWACWGAGWGEDIGDFQGVNKKRG